MPFGHLRSGPSTVSCVPLRGTCLRRTPTHYSSPWVDGSLAVCVSRFSRIIVLACYFALRVYCWLAENQASLLWHTIVRLLWFYLGTRGFRKMLWGLPQIHFGRADGVERTLLRVACQSETFLASPWQGSIDIRVLWHIGCQSEFVEELSPPA